MTAAPVPAMKLDAAGLEAAWASLPEVRLARRGMAVLALELPESVHTDSMALIEAAFKAIADASRPVPLGEAAAWQLVPVEITREMQRAYFDVIDKNMARVTSDATFGRHDSQEEAYRAMLAAAPLYTAEPQASVRDAVLAGWNACRKSVYAVCEDVQERAADTAKISLAATPEQKTHEKGYWFGEAQAAKSIARGFNSMEAVDDDNVTDAIRALSNTGGGK